jgi:hypothetical protein
LYIVSKKKIYNLYKQVQYKGKLNFNLPVRFFRDTKCQRTKQFGGEKFPYQTPQIRCYSISFQALVLFYVVSMWKAKCPENNVLK